MTQEAFVAWLAQAIMSLPQDMKTVLRVVDDPDLDDAHRVNAAGAILHALSSANAIPGLRGHLINVDDVLVLRLVLARLVEQAPDTMQRYQGEAPELFEKMPEQLNMARSFFGKHFAMLENAATQVHRISHQGHSAKSCVADADGGNWLYDVVQEAIVDKFEFVEDELRRDLRNLAQVRQELDRRAV